MSHKPTSDWNPQNQAVLRDQRRAHDKMREECGRNTGLRSTHCMALHEPLASGRRAPHATARHGIKSFQRAPRRVVRWTRERSRQACG